eukprot:CAMPEP_0178909128 /NCGR_PEP_ID=MMETSP0786-20121207/8321_1 /TAXON_ID=186022 /ORGANISM="Thalassionema frauenfeldii, Strain CCMP 1798" /LENGTH=240 /DNA_ID=CAMNT_0020581137 /DNA_START=120 /DNA_END=842 /DNA_ORIENTATION=-
MCYVRYFAMAATVAGGYMSDMDTVPLNIPPEKFLRQELPNQGSFTTYSMHIPALLAGTGEEWQRVGQRLLEEGLQHNTGGGGRSSSRRRRQFSDMYGMLALLKKKEIQTISSSSSLQQQQQQQQVMGVLPSLEKSTKFHCPLMLEYVAVHVSHSAVGPSKAALRGRLMAELLQKYHTDCHGAVEFDQSATQQFFADLEKTMKTKTTKTTSSALMSLKQGNTTAAGSNEPITTTETTVVGA